MSPRRRKETDSERRDAAKRRRAADKEARDAHLRGRPAPEEWDKGGVTKRLNPNPNPMTRVEIRELTFGLAVRKRMERDDHSSKFTKPSLGSRRARRRAANRRARVARRRNW